MKQCELQMQRRRSWQNICHMEPRKGIPALHEGDVDVMFSEYYLRDLDKPAKLLTVTERFMSSVMKIKIGLQWVTSLPSIGHTSTAFVARFSEAEDLETLNQDSGFKDYA